MEAASSHRVRIPLHYLFGLAQYDRPGFDRLLARIETAVRTKTALELPPLGLDENFVKHKTGQFAKRQFEQPRAAGELASNALDSMRGLHGQARGVDIRLHANGVVVSDSGRGMGLREILRELSVPLVSSASAGSIGCFGEGFLSNLSFLGEHASSLRVVTRTAGATPYEAEYRKEGDEYVLYLGEAASAQRRGTRVSVEGRLPRWLKGRIREELEDMFENSEDRITLNGKSLVKPFRGRTARSYRFKAGGGDVTLRVDYRAPGKSSLTQGGVTICSVKRDGGAGRVAIDLPPHLEIGEGRRGFILSEQYEAALGASFRELVGYAEEMRPKVSRWLKERFKQFIGSAVFATDNSPQLTHPYDAYARSATPEEIIRLHNRLAPGSFSPGKPLVNMSPGSAGGGQTFFSSKFLAFAGQDLNAVNLPVPSFSSTHYHFNSGVLTPIRFLENAFVGTIATRDSEEALARYGLEKLAGHAGKVVQVRLSGGNGVPLLVLPGGNPSERTVYLNLGHPVFNIRNDEVRRAAARRFLEEAFA